MNVNTELTYDEVYAQMRASIEGADWPTLRTVLIEELADNFKYMKRGKVVDGLLITKITDHYEETVEIEISSLENIHKAAKALHAELQAKIAELDEEY